MFSHCSFTLVIDLLNVTENIPFTFEEAAAQIYIFFLAGFETSSTTMQYALYELALNPEIQEKLRTEIRNGLDKTGGEATYEGVHEMDYLGRVIDGRKIDALHKLFGLQLN